MLVAFATKIAAFTLAGMIGVFSGHAFSLLNATPHQASSGAFGGTAARMGSLDVNLTGGSLQRVKCARGAQAGARCYLATAAR
jgi:hypothetical protein